MPYLLTPKDEADLVRCLTEELGLSLLLSEVLDQGAPRIAENPLAATASELPPRARAGQKSPHPTSFLFWSEALGSVETLATAPQPSEALASVHRQLNQDAAGDRLDHLLDTARTPVLRWSRCKVDSPQRLLPGNLRAMDCPRKHMPRPVLQAHGRVTRWLQQRGEKLNPFDHCPEAKPREPARLNAFWVWAQPDALRWVQDGGEIWPWTA